MLYFGVIGVVTKVEELYEKLAHGRWCCRGHDSASGGSTSSSARQVACLGVSDTCFEVDEKLGGGMGAKLFDQVLKIVESFVKNVKVALERLWWT